VEAVAEGEREKIERFIEMMKQGPSMSRVDECTVEWEEVTGELHEFGVKRSK
jgi:acylphosphatase